MLRLRTLIIHRTLLVSWNLLRFCYLRLVKRRKEQNIDLIEVAVAERGVAIAGEYIQLQ